MNVELTESERRAYRGVLDSLFVPLADCAVVLRWCEKPTGFIGSGADLRSAIATLCDNIAESVIGTSLFLEPA